MKDCHTYAVEVGEARKRRAEREITMKDTSLESAKAKIKNGRSNGDTRITK